MICKLIQNFGLFVFWKCLDKESREKSITEHRYTKMNTEHIDNIVKKADDYQEKYIYIKERVMELNDLVKDNSNLEEIKTYIKVLAKEVKDV